ncbi:MAG: hypothetical protein ACRDRQ_02125 [Pseudonocardiaceae bacterium]
MSGKDPHDIAPPEHPLIDMIGRRSLMRRKQDADRNSSTATREGTRTSEKHERLGQKRAFSVDLLIAYSKRLDLLSALVSAVKRLRAKDADESETGRNVRSEQAPRVWRVSDRLSEADLCSLVSGYLVGLTARELAERFKINKSSVKRLLRERGIRRTAFIA